MSQNHSNRIKSQSRQLKIINQASHDRKNQMPQNLELVCANRKNNNKILITNSYRRNNKFLISSKAP